MRHLLNLLLRIGRSEGERLALLGDLEEAFRTEVRPSRSWIGAHGWYVREVLAAAACGIRDSIGVPRLRTGIVADVRYGLRRWRRRPGFAVATILTLSLGIAAATATFSVVDGVLLRPLPWKDPDRIVYVHGVYPDRRSNPATALTWNRGTLSYHAWDALRTTPAFETVAAWRPATGSGVTFGENRHDIVRMADVSSNFLPMLGVRLTLGRHFTDFEDDDNSDSIILTWETWQRRFGGRANIIGERIFIGHASSGDQQPMTVVGVLEPGFRFEGEPPEFLRPVGYSAAANRRYGGGALRLVARLSDGITKEQAETPAAGLVAGTRSTEPLSARLVPLADEQLGAARRPLWLLFGGAGLLLLIACSNVAGILLGEARTRSHEMAVRSALGSGRWRLVRQILVEHAMLAIIGTAVGIAVAYWLIRTVVSIAPEGLPRIEAVGLDERAAVFAALSGAATLLLFGVGPAFSLVRTPVAATLAEGGREGAVSRAIGQRLVVIAQLALALVLLTAAALFGESIRRLMSQPLGFDARDVAVMSATFTGHRWGDPGRIREARTSTNEDFGKLMSRLARETSNARDDQVFARVAALPGVSAVSAASAMPFITPQSRGSIVLEGRPGSERHDVLSQVVSERYFDVMRIRLLSGRFFSIAVDHPADSAAAVVSAEFERRFFPAGAVNRRFRRVYGADYELSSHFHIVGVVDDVKRQEFSDDERPSFYSFDRQGSGVSQTHFVIRASGDVRAVLPSVRSAINAVTPQLVVTSTVLMEERVARSVAEERFRAILSAAFGVTALLLAAVGLYGVIARRTAERRREFGIRVALGARPAQVGGLVLRDATVLIACGFAVGVPAAYATAQVTRSLLFGISASSPLVFALTATTLALVAAAASLLPARRASYADPVSALRS
jgi:predicted permease